MILLASSSCKKIEDIITRKLPEATQEGKGTFGCMVDGKLWLPFVQHTLDSEVEATYSAAGGGVFYLRAEQEPSNEVDQYIYLTIANPSGIFLKPGTYTAANGFIGRLEVQKTPANNYVTTPTGSSKLVITKVEPHEKNAPLGGVSRYTIISGTFEFEGTDPDTGKLVKLTDGRFDVQAF